MSHSPEKEQLDVLTVLEAGARLGLGKNASYEAALRGDFPTIRVGRRLKVPKAAFDRFLSGDWPAPRPQCK
jgi:excisionase family DNA binding protein